MAQHLARFATGIEGLDRVLHGGLIEGASYIVQGRPGAGKTILSNQIAFSRAAGGARVLYVTLLSESHERLFQALATLDFFDRSKLGEEIVYISVFQALRDEGLGAVVKLLRRETKRHGATLLVFDGLLNARDRADTDLDVKTFVAEVQSQAGFVGCTVLFLTSTRLEDSSPEHTMVDGVIELNEDLYGVRTARRLQVRKSRGSPAIGGLHKFEITNAGICVYPRLEAVMDPAALRDEPSAKRISSGCPDLDRLTEGGLPLGSVTLTVGPSGSGKTTLGLHFLSRSTVDEPGLHFGFFETPERLHLKAKTLGIDLPSGALDIIWHPLQEHLLDKLGEQLLSHVAAHKVKRLFIDGLGGFERAALHRPRLMEFFAVLTARLRALGVTTMATWETRELAGGEVTTAGSDISAILDNLLVLRTIEEDHDLIRSIAIQKMRDSSFDTRAHLVTFSDKGLSIGAPLGKLGRSGATAAAPSDR